jgi:hypothetical protein
MLSMQLVQFIVTPLIAAGPVMFHSMVAYGIDAFVRLRKGLLKPG